MGMQIKLNNGSRVFIDPQETPVILSYVENNCFYREIVMSDIESIATYNEQDVRDANGNND